MPIRIMHVVDSMVVGGLQNALVNLIERLDPDKFEHIVCAVRHLGPMADRLPRNRVRTIILGKKETGIPIQVGGLARLISEFQPDILHSRNFGAIDAVLAGRIGGRCAVIHSEHGMEMNSDAWRRRVFRRIAFELADRVFAVSYHLRAALVERTGLRLERIGVIHNGVDTERFCSNPQARTTLRQKLGIDDDELCIGAVGRLDTIKDYPTLFRAAERLHKFHRNWRILMVGDGPDFPRLQEFVSSRSALHERVRFLGDSRQVPELLQTMDVYVLPSIFEGISNSLLEAMASGLAVIASQAGGNPEVVVDGQSGFLFPVGNDEQLAEQLLLLCEDSEARRGLGTRAFQRIKEAFSMESMVTQYQRLYTGVLQGCGA